MFLPLLANIPGFNLHWNDSVLMQERIMVLFPHSEQVLHQNAYVWMKKTIFQTLSIWMKETIMAPRQGLYPLFKCLAFDRGTCAKLNTASNRGKHPPWATWQGGMRKQNATSNATGMLPATWQGDAPTQDNRTKNTAICTKNEHNGFVHGRSCWCLRGLWFIAWEVMLAKWLSPVVCSFGKKKIYLTLKY